jgi:hypothetical protein
MIILPCHARKVGSDGGEDVRVTSVLDGHDANAVESAAGGAELDVVAVPVEDLGAAEDGEVLQLSLADGGAVVGDYQELGGSVSELLEGDLVADLGLAGPNGQIELLLEVFGDVGDLSHVDT